MKKQLLVWAYLFTPFLLIAQSAEEALALDEVTDHIQFIASDDLRGRKPGTPGIDIAARYIAHHFEAYGLRQVSGVDGWFQTVPFATSIPPQTGTISLNGKTFTQGENLLARDGSRTELNAPVVFAGYGWVDEKAGLDDFKNIEVRGKIVVVKMGTPNDASPGAAFNAGKKKKQFAKERGALAVIEVYDLAFPWNNAKNFVGRRQATVDDGIRFPHFWLKPDDATAFLQQSTSMLTAQISSPGVVFNGFPSYNVMGIVEGSDPKLKNEYILLTAHYDHVGVGRPHPVAKADSIYNGARDNGMGTVAIITAAKALAAQRPKRSVLIVALTAEEMGLVGSRYLADHPVVPLNNIVFNLNIDNGGWNDTGLITVVGLERTTAAADIKQGVTDFGLRVIDDPAGEQGLFDRSDNVSFAAKGIPAPTFSAGFTAFDEQIMKYYHQAIDQPDENFDFAYLLKYCQTYARVARYIANREERPFWVQGDKYEAVGKSLYGR